MKNLTIIVFLISATYCSGQSLAAEQVHQLHKKKFLWMTNKNYDSLNWVTDEALKFIHSNGWTQTKHDLIEDLKSDKLNYTSIDVQESAVSIFNNQTAVVIGKGTFKGLMPDKSEFNVALIYTEVYIKSKKQWKLVSRHACKP